jgi:hypothetical protein
VLTDVEICGIGSRLYPFILDRTVMISDQDISKALNKEACMALAIRAQVKLASGAAPLARKLGLHRTTIYNWTRNGKIPVEPVNYCLKLHLLTGMPTWFMRPDIYEWPRGAAVATPFGSIVLAE